MDTLPACGAAVACGAPECPAPRFCAVTDTSGGVFEWCDVCARKVSAVEVATAADRDDELVRVPRWVAGVLAEELAGQTDCGGENSEPDCPRCEAIRIALEACENG